MKKNGFTLIEIIVALSLITIIGVGSFVGIRYANHKTLITKLNQISNKASEAAQIYIETNKTATNQLYNNKNGVSLPLQLLVNEGLLTLDGTKLTPNDIKNQYVVTFLGGSGSSENCEQITSINSWSNNQPIYLCMHSDGSSNLAIINPNETSNMSKATREKYYFVGGGASNWIKLKDNDNLFRIIYVDTDDSLVLYAPYIESFGNIFNGVTMPITSIDIYKKTIVCRDINKNPEIFTETSSSNGFYSSEKNINVYTGETNVVAYDVIKTSKCTNLDNYSLDAWMYHIEYYSNKSYEISFGSSSKHFNFHSIRKKIHIKSCMKITDGTGDYSNPFILENKCN